MFIIKIFYRNVAVKISPTDNISGLLGIRDSLGPMMHISSSNVLALILIKFWYSAEFDDFFH